jgi:hypothetical protein
MQMANPYESSASDDRLSDANTSHGRIAIGTCFFLLVPVSIVAGWFLGDIDGIIWHESSWNGPFPITSAPGFTILCILLLIHIPCFLLFRRLTLTAGIVTCSLLTGLEGFIVFATFFGAHIANP